MSAKTKTKKAKSVPKGRQITIQPSYVQCRKEISIDQIVNDPENYRIKHLKLKKQPEIQDHLLMNEDGNGRVKQILSAGQMIEELYVLPVGNKYLAIEGNVRAAALKKINEMIASGKLIPSSKSDFKKVKCIVLKPNLSKSKLRRLLAILHLASKKQWKASNKGAMIYDMINEDSESYQGVGDILDMSKKEIEDLYKAFKMTVEYGQKFSTLNYTRYFSYWHEFFKKKLLQVQATSDPAFKDWVMQLVADNKISEHKQMRTLGDFYGPKSTPEALQKTLDELNKTGGNMEKAKAAFYDYSPIGSLGKIESCDTVLGGITTAALQNSTVQSQLPKALDDLIHTANNVKKQLAAVKRAVKKSSTAIAGVTGAAV